MNWNFSTVAGCTSMSLEKLTEESWHFMTGRKEVKPLRQEGH
jgi:hypothetical protein